MKRALLIAGFVLVLLIGAGAGYAVRVFQDNQAEAARTSAAVAEQHRDQAAVEAVVRRQFELVLVDPESLQLREVFRNGPAICGEYNARNRSGGYTGFRRFIFSNSELNTFEDADDAPTGYYARRAHELMLEADNLFWRLQCERFYDINLATPPPQSESPGEAATAEQPESALQE